MFKKYLSTILILIFGVLIASFAFYGYQIFNSPNLLVDKEDRYFIIPHGASFGDVQQLLKSEDMIHNLVAFSFLAKLMDYHKSVKPGKYLLEKNMNNLRAIRLLKQGKQTPVNITFNNIRLKEDIAEKITKNLGVKSKDFDNVLSSFTKNNPHGFDENTIISMFIPNTYEVYYTTTATQLIDRMYYEYNNFWTENRKKKAQKLGLTPSEVSTLASIVQAESTISDEQPIIAGLYLNRLRMGIPLQADPTLVFAAKDFTIKRVLNIHKQIDSPYNTYKHKGLPPGPINMPSISSIDAVLDHEKHKFIYMCAKEDFSGYHNFATDLATHNANARKYQKALTIEMKKSKM